MGNERHPEIATRLRERIVGGEFFPGERLPSRLELAEQLDVSSGTLQRAIDSLADEGFVEGRGRHGTVVVEHPPFLCNYGILMPCESAPARPLLRSWQSMLEAARQVFAEPPNRLSVFCEGDLQQSMASYQAFLDDVAGHRLAGLIVPAVPVLHLSDLVAGRNGNLPVVTYVGDTFPGVASVRQVTSTSAGILDYLQARGRRRIGQLIPGAWYENPRYEAEFLHPLAKRGMHCERHWLQVVLPQIPQGVHNAAEVLARLPDGPDAIIIHDDNAVQEAIDGIQAAGKRIPEDIVLVARGNFPWPDQYSAPVKRFGVDIMQLVRRAKDYIDACRRGEDPEPIIELDMLEDDVAAVRQLETADLAV